MSGFMIFKLLVFLIKLFWPDPHMNSEFLGVIDDVGVGR